MQWFHLTSDGTAPVDPDIFRRRSETLAASLGLTDRPGAREAMASDDGAILLFSPGNTWIGLPHDDKPRAQRAMTRLATAARATPTPCDTPDVLDAPVKMAHALVPWGATLQRTGRDVDGTDGRILPPENGWVAITIRREGWLENKRIENWVADEFNTQADGSKLRAAGVGVARVTCGAPTINDARDGARGAALALGMGLQSYASHDTGGRGRTLMATIAIAASPLIGTFLPWPNPIIPLAATTLPALTAATLIAGWAHPAGAAWAAGAAAWLAVLFGSSWLADAGLTWLPIAVGTLIAITGITWAIRPRDAVWEAISRRPRHWWAPWPRRRRATNADQKTRMGGNDDNPTAVIHGYALQRTSMLITPTALAGLATPGADTAARTGATRAPDELAGEGPGVILGVDSAGRDVRVAPDRLKGGIAIVGKPGSGKSNLLHAQLRDAGRLMKPGDVLVDFEMKDDAWPTVSKLVDGINPVAMNSTDTPVIDLTGPGNPGERADRFADLMRLALGDEAFGRRSVAQTRAAVQIALTVPSDRLEGLGLTGVHWLEVAAALMGRHGVDIQRALARIATPICPEQVETLGLGVNANGKPVIPDTRLADTLSAPANKLDQLLACPTIWDTSRKSLTWDDVIDNGWRVSVNPTCPSDAATQLLGSMLLNGLRDAVRRRCGGWQDAGRMVVVACDELSLLAGAEPEAVEWFREQGRSFGVKAIFATQNAQQLAQSVQRSFLGFDTLVSFAVTNPDVAAQVAANLDMGRGEWTPARVSGLPQWHAAVRTVGTDGLLPPMVLAVPLTHEGRA